MQKDVAPTTPFRAFTLVEILVVIAVVALLAAILFPAFYRAREAARRVSCASNLQQIGLALRQYSQDFNGYYPLAYAQVASNPDPLPDADGQVRRYSWATQIFPYVHSADTFRCPSNPKNGLSATAPDAKQPLDIPVSYVCNWNEAGLGVFGAADGSMRVREFNVRFPAETIAVAESTSTSPAMDTNDAQLVGKLFSGHQDRGNYLFVDGHVKALVPTQAYLDGTMVKNMWYRDHSPFN